MIILDGKKTAEKLKQEVKEKLDLYYSQGYEKCNLAIVLVGNDPASEVYVRNKSNSCAAVGIGGSLYRLDENAGQKKLEEKIKELSSDPSVHGILVQLPLPKGKGYDDFKATELVPLSKDVDGFTMTSLGATALGGDRGGFTSCTPGGILYLLKTYGIELSGKSAVIIGRSKIVGKPMALTLLNEDCTITVCHSKTRDLKEITSRADIIVATVGKPHFVTADMVKEGAVVVDVGINRTENGLVGDVDFENVSKKASYITPVPGGVGPMTVAYLMKNTLTAYEKANGIK